MRRILAIGAAITTVLVSTAFATGHGPSTLPDTIEFEGRKWRHHLAGRVVVEEHRGKSALYVQGGRISSSVYLPEVEFQNGTIEVDIATPYRSIPGIGFRGRDKGKWRNRIMFSRWRGTDDDKRGVVEQAVVTHRTSTVLLLNIRESMQYGVPEKLGGHDWFHVKVVVQGDTVKVYLNRSKEPSIEVGAMFDGKEKGVLGLCGGHFYFANFQYTTVNGAVPAPPMASNLGTVKK